MWMGKAGSGLAPSLALVSSQGPGHSRVALGQFTGPIRSIGGSPFLVLRGPSNTVPFAFQFLLVPLKWSIASVGIRSEFEGVATAPSPLTCMGSAASSHLPRAPPPPAWSPVGLSLCAQALGRQSGAERPVMCLYIYQAQFPIYKYGLFQSFGRLARILSFLPSSKAPSQSSIYSSTSAFMHLFNINSSACHCIPGTEADKLTGPVLRSRRGGMDMLRRAGGGSDWCTKRD